VQNVKQKIRTSFAETLNKPFESFGGLGKMIVWIDTCSYSEVKDPGGVWKGLIT